MYMNYLSGVIRYTLFLSLLLAVLFGTSQNEPNGTPVKLLVDKSICTVMLFYPDNYGKQARAKINGFGLGLQWDYSDRKYVSLRGNLIPESLIGSLLGSLFKSDYTTISSSHVYLQHGHRMGKLSLGYGIGVGENRFRQRIFDSIQEQYEDNEFQSLVLTTPITMEVGRIVYIGMSFFPSFIRLEGDRRLVYEHSSCISLGLRLGEPRKTVKPKYLWEESQ